jgi:hypothetical protein
VIKNTALRKAFQSNRDENEITKLGNAEFYDWSTHTACYCLTLWLFNEAVSTEAAI